jgi:hypothetical protein
MRLDAWKGDSGWFVFHVPSCAPVKNVAMVDDQAAVYEVYVVPCVRRFDSAGLETTQHKARRIEIYPDRMLVLIDPVEDEGPEVTMTGQFDLAWG